MSFDDVRLVRNDFCTKPGYVYYEDFESVDEGWGPFIASQSSAFTTHLAERHSPYTDNTIDGNWSFHSWRERNGDVCRTSPTLVQFAPQSNYRVEFDYKVKTAGVYKAVVRTRTATGCYQDLTSYDLNRDGRCTLSFTSGASDDTYVVIVKKGDGAIVIDNFGVVKQ